MSIGWVPQPGKVPHDGLNPEEYAAWRIAVLRVVGSSCVGLGATISLLWGLGVLGSRLWGLLPISLACLFASWLTACSEVRRPDLAASGGETPRAEGFGRAAKFAVYGLVLGATVFLVFLSANYGRWGQG